MTLLPLLAVFVWCAPNGIGVPGGDGTTRQVAAQPPQITVVAVEGKTQRALSGASDGSIAVWDLTAKTLQSTSLGKLPGAVTGAVWAGDVAYVVDDQGSIAVVSTATRVLSRHVGGARAITLGASGSQLMLATAGNDGAIGLWSPQDGRGLGMLAGHVGPVTGLAFAGEKLWTVGWDRTLRPWKLRGTQTRGRSKPVTAGPRELTALAMDPAGERMLTACWDGSLRLWDLTQRKLQPRVLAEREHPEWVRQVAFGPDGKRAVALAPAESALLLIDIADPKPVAIPRTPIPACFAFLPGGEGLIVGHFDGSLTRVELSPIAGGSE